MASTLLTTLSVAPGLFDLDNAGLQWPPSLATVSPLDGLNLLNPSWADGITRSVMALGDISGQVVVTAGLFEADLILGDGSLLQGQIDGPATLTQLAALATATTGTATLSGGFLNGSLTTGDDTLRIEDLDLAALSGDVVLNTLSAINTTVDFTNGAFSFAADSALGPLSGTLDIAGGDLNLDLATPLGAFSLDLPFGPSARIPFVVSAPVGGSINGVADFSTGLISVSLGFLGNVAIPIADLSGTLSLADGVASLTSGVQIDTGIPFVGTITVPLSADLEIGPLASEYVAEFVQDLTASLTLSDGIIDLVGNGPLGEFSTSFDVAAFTHQGAAFLAGTDGVLGIGDGLLSADLTTPLGNLEGTFDLRTVAELLDRPLAALV